MATMTSLGWYLDASDCNIALQWSCSHNEFFQLVNKNKTVFLREGYVHVIILYVIVTVNVTQSSEARAPQQKKAQNLPSFEWCNSAISTVQHPRWYSSEHLTPSGAYLSSMVYCASQSEALRFESCDNFRDLINAHNCSRDDCITDIVIVSNVHLYISAFQTISTAVMAMWLRPSQSEALRFASSEVTHVCSLVQGDKIEPCQTFTERLNEWSNLHSNCHFLVFLMACPASSSNIVTWTHLCFNPLLICAWQLQ